MASAAPRTRPVHPGRRSSGERPGRGRPVATVAAISVLVSVLLAACAQAPAATGGPSAAGPSVSVTPPSGAVPSAAGPSVSVVPSSPPKSSEPAPSGVSAPAVDPSLLSILPAAVDERPIAETPDAEGETIGDPAIARAVERLALAFAASEDAADWAIASVARLRPGTWSDAFYRDWRDSYDSGVCATHGGVTGNASATIAGREIEIATCGPLHTYHVHLAGPDVLVSVASVGERRYGELMMAGLRP